MKKRISFFVFVLMTFAIISCDDTLIYEDNQSFDGNTWSYQDSKSFSFDVKDSLQPIKLFINLRTTVDYPYRNIFMFLHSNYPNGYVAIDTLEFFLADPKGNWLGDNSGTVIENSALISKGLFPSTGTHTFRMEQAMRNDSLPEILDIGLRVELMTK